MVCLPAAVFASISAEPVLPVALYSRIVQLRIKSRYYEHPGHSNPIGRTHPLVDPGTLPGYSFHTERNLNDKE